MKITFELNTFKQEFLNPILEVNKLGKSAIFVENDSLYCITSINNNSIILYNSYKPFKLDAPLPRFNVDLGKISKAILCAKPSSNLVTLSVNDTTVTYEDDATKFNIRL